MYIDIPSIVFMLVAGIKIRGAHADTPNLKCLSTEYY